ncbi:MAG: CoB--CoM heterodisulfide reductase iron-sulfur subunit A family protein [Bacteroidales bacterium]|nr:CoB--CoM heterodisulfide reductase iron-sulfur subunit A family protein [Bacteroidales bacterium]
MKRGIVIGGGIAGVTAASALAKLGIEVALLEKEPEVGGHLRNWDRLFPSRRKSTEVLQFLTKQINSTISIHTNQKVVSIQEKHGHFVVETEKGLIVEGDSILLATGFELFDASKKEEYGYGIYENVITSVELERMFQDGKGILTQQGTIPKRIGFIHCVGSRDEKVGHLYCSKVCCVTGVKQAIEIKETIPEAEVFGFYMDLRMFDRYFEEMYFEAQQQWGINFIRGRLSECSENPDHSILVKVEDTLTSRPLRMTVDLLVLLVGFIPSAETNQLASMLEIPIGEDGFLEPVDEHTLTNSAQHPGVFLAGALKGPVCISETFADARATAVQMAAYLNPY